MGSVHDIWHNNNNNNNNNQQQQQPTTTNNNQQQQQQPTTTNNNQQQPTTTNNNQQQQPTTTTTWRFRPMPAEGAQKKIQLPSGIAAMRSQCFHDLNMFQASSAWHSHSFSLTWHLSSCNTQEQLRHISSPAAGASASTPSAEARTWQCSTAQMLVCWVSCNSTNIHYCIMIMAQTCKGGPNTGFYETGFPDLKILRYFCMQEKRVLLEFILIWCICTCRWGGIPVCIVCICIYMCIYIYA